MMHSLRWLVAGSLALGSLYACGGTTKNNVDSDGSNDSTDGATNGSTSSNGPTNTTGGVTSSGSSGPTTGTGGTTSDGCPTFEPSPGSSCSKEGDVCEYLYCSQPGDRDDHQLTCQMGAWTLTATDICEVASCPPGGPPIGGYCDARVAPGSCTAIDACGVARQVSCIDDTWQVDAGDSDVPQGAGGASGALPLPDTSGGVQPIVCPEYPPYWGSSCCPDNLPDVCDYRPSSTDGGAGASFIIIPTDPIDTSVSNTGTGTSGSGASPPLDCAVCAADTMTWEPCEP